MIFRLENIYGAETFLFLSWFSIHVEAQKQRRLFSLISDDKLKEKRLLN